MSGQLERCCVQLQADREVAIVWTKRSSSFCNHQVLCLHERKLVANASA